MKKIYMGLFVLFCFFSASIVDVMALQEVNVKVTQHFPMGNSTSGARITIGPGMTYQDFRDRIGMTFRPFPRNLTVEGKTINENNWYSIRDQTLLKPNPPTIEGTL